MTLPLKLIYDFRDVIFDKNVVTIIPIFIVPRSGYVLFDKTVKLKGIPVGEWYLPKELYANPSEVPDNIGFCTPDEYSCVPTGLINVTECYDGKRSESSLNLLLN